ncbi:response regulator transcription factor [Sphingomonas antarctica]|uniref:response regulator transcription factor n=1 Tax=Sphingomonas antarctica TaxID=2040274 RepID=UPI0039E78079
MLTERQRQVLALLCEGHGNREIRRRLCIAERTVRAHDRIVRRSRRAQPGAGGAPRPRLGTVRLTGRLRLALTTKSARSLADDRFWE